ncbi:MAG TPA: hypothetical protein VIF39_16275 [Hyphomicrobium sp.]
MPEEINVKTPGRFHATKELIDQRSWRNRAADKTFEVTVAVLRPIMGQINSIYGREQENVFRTCSWRRRRKPPAVTRMRHRLPLRRIGANVHAKKRWCLRQPGRKKNRKIFVLRIGANKAAVHSKSADVITCKTLIGCRAFVRGAISA